LIKNIDEYLDKLKPKNWPEEDDSGLFGESKPRKKTALEEKIEALKEKFTSNDPGIKVNGRELKAINPKIEKQLYESSPAGRNNSLLANKSLDGSFTGSASKTHTQGFLPSQFSQLSGSITKNSQTGWSLAAHSQLKDAQLTVEQRKKS